MKVKADSSVLLLNVRGTDLETPLCLNLSATGHLNKEHLNFAWENAIVAA